MALTGRSGGKDLALRGATLRGAELVVGVHGSFSIEPINPG